MAQTRRVIPQSRTDYKHPGSCRPGAPTGRLTRVPQDQES